MNKATKLDDLYDVLSSEALTIDNMEDFYYDGTMEVRTGDKYESPTLNIFDSICKRKPKKAFLFMGHQGCGKSTELNELSIKLANEGFMVKTIDTSLEIDMQNASYWDLLILIGKKMIEMAKDCHCNIREKTLKKLEVEQSASEWFEMIDSVSQEISKKFESKRPVIIFEDLDKLREEIAWAIFFGYANVMTDIPLYIIYTFPIALSYSPKFGSVAPFFQVEVLPMIKIHFPNMDECQEGIKTIEEILFKRADESLISKDALREAIINTGGCIGDLFDILLDSSKRATRRSSNEIELEDVNLMLTKFKSELTKRIEEKDYDFLKSIYDGKKMKIKDREALLEMMQAQAVLEYNSTRWHDLHPLVAKFFKEQGIV